jgi:hypothetical protein
MSHVTVKQTQIPTADLPESVVTSSQGNFIPLKQFDPKWEVGHDSSKGLEEAVAFAVASGFPEIRLPGGTGEIAKVIKLPKNLTSTIVIRGTGEHSTVIKLGMNLTFLTWENTSTGDTVGNVEISDFTVDGNNQQVPGNIRVCPVVLGVTENCVSQVNCNRVRVRRIATVNVPVYEEEASARRLFVFACGHAHPGLPMNTLEDIDIRECPNLNGGQLGVTIEGYGNSSIDVPVNIRLRKLYLGDLFHKAPEPTKKYGYQGNFQIGQSGWTDEPQTIVIERCKGENGGDVGIEIDIPCVLRDLLMINPNNEGYLFNSFNAATTQEPVVTKITAEVKATETSIKVASSAAFSAGQQIVIAGSEVRTVSATPDSEHIEVSEGLHSAHVVSENAYVQLVDDMAASKWFCTNLATKRTSKQPNSNRSVVISNIENVIPMPGIDIDGLQIDVTSSDSVGSDIIAQYGTSTSPTGGPQYLSIRRLWIDRKNYTYSGTSAIEYNTIALNGFGPAIPVTIQGEVTLEGSGITSSGKIKEGVLINVAMNAILDIDVITKFVLGSTGGEPFTCIGVNLFKTGDCTGRIRHRTRASSITSGGGTLRGVRLGKGSGFASKSVITTLTAEAAAKTLELAVTSSTNFQVGMPIVIDATSNTKAEIMFVEAVEAGKLKLIKENTTSGTKEAHLAGATVAAMKELSFTDCDWLGLGPEATGLSAEDGNVYAGVRMRGTIFPKPPVPSAVSVQASEAPFRPSSYRSGNLTIIGGTVTSVSWSPNGVNFTKIGGSAAAGYMIHVSSGDYIKITWSAAPTVEFTPDHA